MSDYHAPVEDMHFAMQSLVDLSAHCQLPGFEETSDELIDAVLNEAARFTGEVLGPLNHSGDQQGATIENNAVTQAPGFKEAYQQYVEGGWAGLAASPEQGGQGLPELVNCAVMEMVESANISFSLCPLLTIGAINAVNSHGSDELKEKYLPKMITGEWTGTMNLTESQAGSDLSVLRTKAVPNGDHYLLSGQKIFITWGDHQMTENTIHLVLARTPDAPEGTRGISLFLVPKFLVNDDGSIGERNDVYATAIEHKLGIHASPTCVMTYGENGGAVGYLVGEENHGLAHMFTMMNHARIYVGLQGLAVAERAFQQAREYARERVQGGVPIIEHADVKRMLLTMKSGCEAMRALTLVTNAAYDVSHRSTDAESAAAAQRRVDLLTPIVKGWCTELGVEITSLGVQVHGGMGFIEETGAAQHLRDSRVLPIYEGTNGIQALDLVGRKILKDQGAAMLELMGEMQATQQALQAEPELADIHTAMASALDELQQALVWLKENAADQVAWQGGAHYLMMLGGTVVGGWLMAKQALAAQAAISGGDSSSFYAAKLHSVRAYNGHYLSRSSSYLRQLREGGASLNCSAEMI